MRIVILIGLLLFFWQLLVWSSKPKTPPVPVGVVVIGNDNVVIDGNCTWKDGQYQGDEQHRVECEKRLKFWQSTGRPKP